MSPEERILTLHPEEGKTGVNINRLKYDQVRDAIIETLVQEGQMTFQGLGSAVEAQLAGHFDGSVSWYYTTVKLDLEARGIIRRVGTGSPQRLELVS